MEPFLEQFGNGRTIGLFLVLFVTTVASYVHMTSNRGKCKKKVATTGGVQVNLNQVISHSGTKSSLEPVPVDDVWEERRRRGIVLTSSSKKEDARRDKPFGSSYYYAHNNTKSKGGYADGLSMEDFTMNGPRLLKKSGIQLEQQEAEEKVQETKNPPSSLESSSAQTLPPIADQDPQPISSNSKKICKDITRYLWDDPGDSSGIGTIRIDTLPGNSSTERLAWKDAKIQSVSATLEGEGLLVIATDNDKNDYRLYIRRLYDKATEVRTVVKVKRLLVKIYKKRNTLNFLGTSNLEAWPHPQRKDFIQPKPK